MNFTAIKKTVFEFPFKYLQICLKYDEDDDDKKKKLDW
jgi:hypothetical protein